MMNNNAILHRFSALGDRDRFDSTIKIEPGTLDDYRALAPFHYRGAHVGVMTSILRAVVDEPSAVDRYLNRASRPQAVGVLVRGLPRLACRMRDDALGDRYRALSRSEAARMINSEIRTISRVIVEPRYRGCGVAVQLVRHALAHPEVHQPPLRYTEALAAMGLVCPFFERAGMKKYQRPPRPEHVRLLDALSTVGIAAPMLASTALLQEKFFALTNAQQAWLIREIRRWRRNAFRESSRSIDLHSPELLNQLRSELSKQPVYYIWRHDPKPVEGTQ